MGGVARRAAQRVVDSVPKGERKVDPIDKANKRISDLESRLNKFRENQQSSPSQSSPSSNAKPAPLPQQTSKKKASWRNFTQAPQQGRNPGATGEATWGRDLQSSPGVNRQATLTHQNRAGAPPEHSNAQVRRSETAQGQLDDILAEDSPLMQRARTQGLQHANSRGLLNSTMAGEASTGAMIDRATPIAQQDAQTHAKRGEMGYQDQIQQGQMHYANQLGQDDMRLQQQLGELDREHSSALQRGDTQLAAQLEQERMGLQDQIQRGQMGMQHEYSLESQEWSSRLDQEVRGNLMELEHGFSRISQNSDHANETYKAAMQAIGMLNTNPDMSPEQQKEGSKQITDMMSAHLGFLNKLYA